MARNLLALCRDATTSGVEHTDLGRGSGAP